MKRTFFAASVLFATRLLLAQNPISPMGVYIADPTARVDKDGRMYIYGSLDVSPKGYCSKDYHVLSSANLRQWTLHPYSFSWNDVLYAPDLICRNGIYYLYYDTPSGHEFVATGTHPQGPFGNGQKIEGPRQIDPNIFIDDDGQAYYFWGQFSAKGAKMNPDMKTLDMSTYKDGIVTEKDHFFHEGSFVMKRGKYYYFIYADISRKQRPTSIGYAMSTSPLGPYTYKGVIVDNAGCDPQSWNNHGSVVQFNGQWYVLYHRSTHNCRTMRKACIEPICFNADGTIDEVEMTSQGAASPLNAFAVTDAAKACRLQGKAYIRLMEDQPNHEVLGNVHAGDAVVWKYLDFGKGGRRFTARLKSTVGAMLTVRADGPEGEVLCRMDVPAKDDWQELTVKSRKIKGVHALWIDFSDAASVPIAEGTQADIREILTLDWFRFQ